MYTTFDARPGTRLFSCSRVLFMVAVAAAVIAYGCSSSSADKNGSGGTPSGATGGSGNSGQTGGTSGDGGTETLPAPDGIGTFTITLVPVSDTGTAAHTTVSGVVREASLPPSGGTIWTVKASDAGCKLVTPSLPFCDTDCASSEVCVAGGICKATDPTHHSVGTVTIEGVATTAGGTLTMNPTSSTTYASLGASYPPFTDGASVRLVAQGADYPGFTIDGKGISTLALGNITSTLALNQPINLAWTPPAQTGNSRILINVDISQHGTTKGQIVCDVDDNGSLTIPAPLVTALIQLGVAGFPTIGITRQAKTSATITQGRVDLLLVSSIETVVNVQGYTSCHTDTQATDCPSGQICQAPPYLCVTP